MVPKAIALCGYDWDASTSPPRLVRRGSPHVLKSRSPYRATGLAIGAAYVLTSLWGSPPLLFFGAFGELPALWMASWFSVDVEAERQRRWVSRDITFASAGQDGYRADRAADVIVDGENIGQATAVAVVRWRHHDSGMHGEHKVVHRYEVSIATARGAVTLHEGAEEEPAIAFAQHLVETLGHAVPLVDRTDDASSGPNWVLWAVPFLVAAVITPLQMDATRRALIGAAAVIAILSNVVATSAWIASRGRLHLRTIYGIGEPSVSGFRLPFRYALTFACAAHLLLLVSILAPGGPHIAPR